MVVLLVAAIPIWRLTHHRVDAAADSSALPAADRPTTPTVAVSLRIEFTSAPRAVRLWHVKEELWAVANPPLTLERTLHIAWPTDGVDLRVQIDWPDGAALAAARFSLITPDGIEEQRSVWGAGPTDEVLTFP